MGEGIDKSSWWLDPTTGALTHPKAKNISCPIMAWMIMSWEDVDEAMSQAIRSSAQLQMFQTPTPRWCGTLPCSPFTSNTGSSPPYATFAHIHPHHHAMCVVPCFPVTYLVIYHVFTLPIYWLSTWSTPPSVDDNLTLLRLETTCTPTNMMTIKVCHPIVTRVLHWKFWMGDNTKEACDKCYM